MLRFVAARSARRRRGAILIVVLAMLVLFAVVGLSFVLYSESQLASARNYKEAANDEGDGRGQMAAEARASAERWLGVMTTGAGDTGDDLMIPFRGHDFARSKYGYQAGQGNYLPYAGREAFNDVVSFNGLTDGRQIVRYTWDPATNNVFDPERWYNGAAVRNDPNNPVLPGMYRSKSVDFTYPDRHDFYLAFQDPATGEIVLPSFHRPDLFANTNPMYAGNPAAQIAESLNPNNPRWTDAHGKYLTLRPRPAEHPNFRPVPANPDGSFTGDVANMKFVGGTQQKNDSLWVYAGGPVKRWRGKNYTACVAALVLDLNGRVNLSVAGNLKNRPNDAANPHAGSQGWGQWEVNPMAAGLTALDLETLVQRRYGKSGAFPPAEQYTPPADPFTAAFRTDRINGGRAPGQAALIDADGVGPVANDGPMALPASAANGGFNPYPRYNSPLVAAPPFRFAPTQPVLTNELAAHPAQFNPLVYRRQPNTVPTAPAIGAGPFGVDDLVKLSARGHDSKARYKEAKFGEPQLGPTSLTPDTDTPAARRLRAVTTTYGVTQQWGTVLVRSATGIEVLGPVDVNRPLPDFRKNPLLPASPLNLWNPAVGGELPYYLAARTARHTLARDIFIRLAGAAEYIDNVSARYDPATGNVIMLNTPAADPKVKAMMELAQGAANIVDYIDGDDLVTPFVWNPTAASIAASPNDPSLHDSNFAAAEVSTRVVFGTEQPRLVINEAYSAVFNTRDDPFPMMGGQPRASRALKRRYWLELHNPSPVEPASSPAHDGSARLRYETGITPLVHPVSGPTTYAGPTFNVYRLEVADAPPPVGGGIATPYSDFLSGVGLGLAGSDTAGVPGMTLRARIDGFVHDSTDGAATLAGTPDELNIVRPATAVSGGNGRNEGYYVIGPRDQHPAGGVTNTLSLADAPAGVPNAANPVNALTYDATAGAPTDANLTTELGRSSVVLLRRLADPYRPLNDPTVPGYDNTKPVNLFVTTDYLENVPTRDRAKHSTQTSNRMASDAAGVGRIHPFAAAPAYNAPVGVGAVTAVQDQGGAATPPHSFFGVNNNPADNNRGGGGNTFGFEWLVHPDREVVSLPELLHVSALSPARLTQGFFTGVQYQGQIMPPTSPFTFNMMMKRTGPLEVGSRLPGVPLGGREPGKVNINTANDLGVVRALFGRTDATHFAVTNPTQVDEVWNRLSPAAPPGGANIARTPNRVPRATVYEGGGDYPLMWGSSDYFYGPAVRSDASPLFRRFETGNGQPVFRNPFATGNHPHLNAEPLRKAWNNMTPVSDSFLVVMTFGFFEVENNGPWGVTNPPVLGAELFDRTPGDLRSQFAAVVDRSQLFTHIVTADATGTGTGVVQPVANDPDTNTVTRGVQTKLVADVQPSAGPVDIYLEAIPAGGVRPDGATVTANTCAIPGDGMVYTVGVGSRVRVGYGDHLTPTKIPPLSLNPMLDTNSGDGEWLTVTEVAQRQWPDAAGTLQNVPGQVRVRVASVARPHPAGAPVGNVLFGNPGPQAKPTLEQLRRRGLVPYFTRLEK